MKNNRVDGMELVLNKKNGDTMHCLYHGEIITIAGEQRLLSIANDITNYRKAEEDKERFEKQLQQAQKMEAIGTLAGGIAHDFNNILFPLVGFAEMLEEDIPEDSPFQESIKEVLSAALRAKELVNQILTFSRQEPRELKPLRMHIVLKEALKLLRASIPKTIDIQIDLNPDCGMVTADPTQIHQIIMNLATNAYHAMQESGGVLKVTLAKVDVESGFSVFSELIPGEYAVLKVSDTGAGMSPQILEKVFDPYFTTKKKGRGTGLGLSVIQGIVKSYKGDIQVFSDPGKGSEFHVFLPIMKKVLQEKKNDQPLSIMGGTEKILLVDDEEAVTKMAKLMLERLGYKVTTRTKSIEALEAFKANPDKYDLLITDMTMPNMTGVQLTRHIKKLKDNIPVIVCTGFSDQIDERLCRKYNIQGFIMKPIVTKEFAQKIRLVLDNNDAKI